MIAPARSEIVRYRQSPIAAGGTAPINRSRAIPPEISRDEGEDQHAEEIKTALKPRTRPTEREYERAGEVEHQRERPHDRTQHNSPMTVKNSRSLPDRLPRPIRARFTPPLASPRRSPAAAAGARAGW